MTAPDSQKRRKSADCTCSYGKQVRFQSLLECVYNLSDTLLSRGAEAEGKLFQTAGLLYAKLHFVVRQATSGPLDTG